MKRPAVIQDIYLRPGEFHFGSAATRIRTLLGSCVAIVVWHPVRLLGGMCHFILPSRANHSGVLEAKYADEAFTLFHQHADRHSTSLVDYQIKVFGGGNMFPSAAGGGQTVSQKNIAAVAALLRQYQLRAICSDMGGNGSRSVIFEIWSGSVWVRYQPLVQTANRA